MNEYFKLFAVFIKNGNRRFLVRVKSTQTNTNMLEVILINYVYENFGDVVFNYEEIYDTEIIELRGDN